MVGGDVAGPGLEVGVRVWPEVEARPEGQSPVEGQAQGRPIPIHRVTFGADIGCSFSLVLGIGVSLQDGVSHRHEAGVTAFGTYCPDPPSARVLPGGKPAGGG